MNVTINSQLLAQELRALNKIVPTKPTFEILSHTLVTTTDVGLEFYATDLEVSLQSSCECMVNEHGKTAVPVAKLLQMVEQFPDGDVTLSVDKAQVLIRCGGFVSRLRVHPVNDFPQVPIVEGEQLTLDAGELRTLIARTRHAVSANASKYVLKGALLSCYDSVDGNGAKFPTASMVATEGKRLALAFHQKSEGPPMNIVIPAKALDSLAEGSEEGVVTMTVGPRHMFFAVNGKTLTSRKLEGEFPQYKRIIPGANDKVIVADRMLLTAALKRVVLAAEENGAIYASFTSGRLELSSASAGIGSAFEPLEVAYDGAPLKVLINGEAVLDFLNAADKPTIEIKLKDEKTAALLSSGADHISVIMLMRP